MALHWFGEYVIRFQFLLPTGVFCFRQRHRLSCNGVVTLFNPAAGARPKEAKINLIRS